MYSSVSETSTDREVFVRVFAMRLHTRLCVHACLHACLHVRVCTLGCADLVTLDTMTPQERKRQGYIHELIQTEETYVEDLELVLEVGRTSRAQTRGL